MSRETRRNRSRSRGIRISIAVVFAAIVSLALALPGCSSSNSSESTVVEGTTPVSAVGESGPGLYALGGVQYTISVSNGDVDPAKLDIPDGAGVLFINAEDDTGTQHELVSDDGSFDTGVLDPGGQYFVVFAGGGIVNYHDAMNPDIKGEIVVAAGETQYGGTIPFAGPIVSVANNGLSAATTRIVAGERVTFYNAEDDTSTQHELVADDGSFDTGVLNPGDSYSVTFEGKGTYPYHDALDSAISGTITVE